MLNIPSSINKDIEIKAIDGKTVPSPNELERAIDTSANTYLIITFFLFACVLHTFIKIKHYPFRLFHVAGFAFWRVRHSIYSPVQIKMASEEKRLLDWQNYIAIFRFIPKSAGRLNKKKFAQRWLFLWSTLQ